MATTKATVDNSSSYKGYAAMTEEEKEKYLETLRAKKYSDMTAEEQKIYLQDVKKRSNAAYIATPTAVNEDTATKKEDTLVGKSVKATENVLGDYQVDQSSETEKKLMDGKTDDSLYETDAEKRIAKRQAQAAAVSKAENEKKELERLSNLNLPSAEKQKVSLENQLEEQKKADIENSFSPLDAEVDPFWYKRESEEQKVLKNRLAQVDETIKEKSDDSAGTTTTITVGAVNATQKDIEEAKARKEELEKQLEEMRKSNIQSSYSPSNAELNPFWYNQTTAEEKELEKEINALNKDISLAERAYDQSSILNPVDNANDFAKYVTIGEQKAAELESVDPTLKNINGKQVRAYKQSATYKTNDDRKDYMTDDEKSIYNYYLGKYGEDKADEYLDALTETLNYRKAAKAYEGNEGNVLASYMTALNSGVSRFGDSLRDSVRMLYGDDEYVPTSAAQYQSSMAREGLADTGFKLPQALGGASLGQVGYDLVENTANMLPSIAVGGLGGATAAAVTTGIGAAGSAYNEALGEGYTPQQAASYAVLSGASEAALGELIGGITATGGISSEKVLEKLIPKIKGALKKTAVSAGVKMLSEGNEEYLQEVLTPIFRNLAFMEDNEIDLLSEDALYSAFIGALNAGVLNLPNNVSQYANYKINDVNSANDIDTNLDGTAQQTAQAQNNSLSEQTTNITPETQNAQIQANTSSQLTFEERAEQLYREGKSWGEIGKALQAEYYPNETAKDVTDAARNYIRKSDFYGQKGVAKNTADEQAKIEMQNQLIAGPSARTVINQDNTENIRNNTNPWGYNLSERYLRNANGDGTPSATNQQSINMDTVLDNSGIDSNVQNNAIDINNLLLFLQNNIGTENLAEYLKDSKNVASLVQYLQRNNANNGAQISNNGAQSFNLQNAFGAQTVNNGARNIDDTVYVGEENAPTPSERYYEQDGNSHPNTVGAMRNKSEFYTGIDKYGAQPIRQEQIARNNLFEVPKKLSDNVAMSEEVGYMAGSVLGDDAFMDDVILNPKKYSHEINTDEGSISRAAQNIKKNGITQEFTDFQNKFDADKRIRKDDLTKAELMAKFYADLATKETNTEIREQYKKNAIKLKQEIILIRTESGQNVQSAKIMQQIDDISAGENTANFNLFASENLVEELNKRIDIKNENKRFGKKEKNVVLNQDLVNKALDAAGTDAEGTAWDAVYKDLANQTSTGFWQRANNYRYFCMLSNPATHIRNIDANLVMFTTSAVKDTVKIGVEKIFNAAMEQKSKKAQKIDTKLQQLIANNGIESDIAKLQKKSDNLHKFDDVRSKTAAVPKASQISYAWNDFTTANENYSNSNKWTDSASTNEFIKEYKTNSNSDFINTYLSKKIEGNNKFSKAIKTVLEHGAFGSVMDFNSWLLGDVEDGFAKRLVYSNELAQRMQANGITAETANGPANAEIMNRLRAEAMVESFYNTFNEDNKISNKINDLASSNAIAHVVVESIMPFKKVPLNIIKTGADYSVIGLAKGIGEVAKVLNNPNGNVDVSSALNDVAKGMTGTGLLALGAFLRSIGKITNGLSDDDDEQSYQKLIGEQAYALKFSDGSSYTIDWIGAPIMSLFSGALLYDSLSGELEKKLTSRKANGDINWETTLKNYGQLGIDLSANLVSSLVNPIVEMSMLSNLEGVLTTQYKDGKEFIIDIFGDYANEYVPQMLYGITKVVDNTKRNSYYVDKTDNIPDTIQQYLQTAQSKIPGLSSELSAQVDAWGREKTWSESDSVYGRIFDAFLSPGKYSSNKETEQDKLLSQLVAKTGDTSLYPDISTTKTITVNNVKYDLSADEYESINKEKGQTQYKLVGELLKNSAFKALSSDEQAEVVKDIYEYSTASAKEGIHNYALGTGWEKLENAKKDGLAMSDYLAIKNTDRENNKASTIIEVINNTKGLSDSEKITAMKYIADLNTDKYTIFTDDPEEIAIFQKAISDDEKKEGDIKQLVANGYSAAEALAKYNVASGSKKYENGEFKFGNSTAQAAKAAKLEKMGYDPETIVIAANAVTSINKSEYGVTKNYTTCCKMLEAVGITDKKFQKAFWSYYVAT